jgi:hypothetical protein
MKRLREDAQSLREERTTLEGMIQSRDELILQMVLWTQLHGRERR